LPDVPQQLEASVGNPTDFFNNLMTRLSFCAAILILLELVSNTIVCQLIMPLG
jgi:hypothetical protein